MPPYFYSMVRDKYNGVRKVSLGIIVQTNIKDFDEAVTIKKQFVRKDNNYSFEITGTKGNYKIIRRELTPSESDYIN